MANSFLEVALNPVPHKPRVRLVVKSPQLQLPVAQEPPPPVLSSTKTPPPSKKGKPPKAPKPSLALKRQQYQADYQKATELSLQHPGMHPQTAYQIFLGHFTVEDWYAGCRKRKENRESRLQKYSIKRQRRIESSGGSLEEERAWTAPFLRNLGRELVWLEVAGKGDLIARIQQVTVYDVRLQLEHENLGVIDKTQLSALAAAATHLQILGMRQITGDPLQREAVPSPKLSERWPFPHDLLPKLAGQRIRVQLLNGSSWMGFFRWSSPFTFLLGAEPTGEAEVLIFKHACCGLVVLT